MTKYERKRLIKMLYASIYCEMSRARIRACDTYDLTLMKLERIEAHAYAQMVQFVEGF